jgi:Flp pilus assembly protein TadB
VLAVGVSLEQAIQASLRSTPDPIRPQVETLVARLATRWQTDAALRAFADDLDDATGDLVAASLILSAKRRGAGLVAVLDGLAAVSPRTSGPAGRSRRTGPSPARPLAPLPTSPWASWSCWH